MADPFQDVDAAGDAFISAFADSMDERQSDPTMEQIVSAYLSKVDFPEGSLTVEVGCGAGAVTRRIAAKASPERVVGFEPSAGFVREAKLRLTDQTNVAFEIAGGATLPLDDGSVDTLILHTVLTHVEDPVPLLNEAARVLKSGGSLIVCDADFAGCSQTPAGQPAVVARCTEERLLSIEARRKAPSRHLPAKPNLSVLAPAVLKALDCSPWPPIWAGR